MLLLGVTSVLIHDCSAQEFGNTHTCPTNLLHVGLLCLWACRMYVYMCGRIWPRSPLIARTSCGSGLGNHHLAGVCSSVRSSRLFPQTGTYKPGMFGGVSRLHNTAAGFTISPYYRSVCKTYLSWNSETESPHCVCPPAPLFKLSDTESSRQ